jgi:glycosyltransferase involved in cell wall biosynthesis
MTLCFVADLRSAIAQNWIRYFVSKGFKVHVVSTFPCGKLGFSGMEVHESPIGFSGLQASEGKSGQAIDSSRSKSLRLVNAMKNGPLGRLVTDARFWITPLEIYRHVGHYRRLIDSIKPDIVHAMRIPFEGIIASMAVSRRTPLITSVWGNDFTLFASRYPMIGWQTRRVLSRTDVLHCDCHRDARLARTLGFADEKPSPVLPGAGGVQRNVFYPGIADKSLELKYKIAPGSRVIINPRGMRIYVLNEAFFMGIVKVARVYPNLVVLCTGMAGNPIAEGWVNRFGISQHVKLLPHVDRSHMAELFRLAEVAVSPSIHDGTPNTLLESMACGCFPIAGDIESIREWIVPGENGLLCAPDNPEALADAMIKALRDPGLREGAKLENTHRIAELADHGHVMLKAETMYSDAIEGSRNS